MTESPDNRPDPDTLLQRLKEEEEKNSKGRLKIFFGMSAGVGKTYDMLKAAQIQRSQGVDVVVGLVETHGRADTEALLEGLPLIPRRKVEYRGSMLEEMDLDTILSRRPALVLVDELAHSNAAGSRHTKRFQDVLEILDHGISVYTTLNVQHLESRADTIAQITGAVVRETVPDSIFDAADEIELVDLPPEELLKRLDEGKVYVPEQASHAVRNFFRKGNLTALRELALRLTAERVDHQLREIMRAKRIAGPWKSSQRLVVALSASPTSVALIRWARRVAYTMDASWIAVYVETSRPPSAVASAQLSRNLELARELGAEIITTADEDVVQGVLRVARENNASHLLIGKSRRPLPFRTSLLDRIITQSGNLDVYVVGGTEEGTPSPPWTLPSPHSNLRHYLLTGAVVAVLSSVCYLLQPLIGYQLVSLVLLLAIALLSLRFGIGPVLAAAGLSALVWDFFFIPPRFTFAISKAEDALMFAAYFVIATVTGILTSRVRARERAVRTREERAVALYTLTQELSAANSLDAVVDAAVRNIRRFFNAEVVVCLSENDGDLLTKPHPASSLRIDDKEYAVAAWAYWNEKRAGRFTPTLPSAEAAYYPLSGPRYPLGVVGVKLVQGDRLALDQETLLENFLRQFASSLEREQLHELARKTIVLAESERLTKTLLDSLSHEFKTPIAAILGSVEHLAGDEALRNSRLGEVVREIHDAAYRLNRLVSNLLDMTRLESGSVRPRLDWCDPSDLAATAVRKLDEELAHHPVTVAVGHDLPLVRTDYTLLEQALTNLLHNAAVHTPPGTTITVSGEVRDHHLLLSVEDNGPGIPAEYRSMIFQKFSRAPGSGSGGTGLGLSIAKGFVEALNGTLTFQDRPGGGSRFVITLPVDAAPASGEPA